jgi:hypothetical protein
MARRENFSAKGHILLFRECWESASGHAETDKGAKLYAVSDNTVMLETFDDDAQFIGNTYNNKNHEYYEISVEDLIQLLKTKGDKTTKKDPVI